MNQEELKQQLIELLLEYDQMRMMRMGIAECADYLIANGVTIRERGEWIPVTERLPVKGSNVLIYSKSGGRAEGELCEDGWWQYRWCCPQKDVTHWMPLPEPPEAEKGGER